MKVTSLGREGPQAPMLLAVLWATALINGCGPTTQMEAHRSAMSRLGEAWSPSNDPALLLENQEVILANLPLSGKTPVRPWADTYWPNFQGGLAQRWSDPSYPDPFSYALYREEDIRQLSHLTLSQLSPAEKYDIYMGNFEYPLVRSERLRTSPNDPGWFGLCHGWAPAALNFREPSPTTVMGPSGVSVPFGSSDIKALLTFAQQFGTSTHVVGERCNFDLLTDPERARDPSCRDINAGTFHIALGNLIGRHQRGFIAEIARGYQVWNQPAYAYRTELLSESPEIREGAAPGTVKIVRVVTTLRYVAEIGPHWTVPAPLVDESQDSAMILTYDLELGQDGAILGGEWLTEEHPDFLWTQSPPEWSGYYRYIDQIYEAAVEGRTHDVGEGT